MENCHDRRVWIIEHFHDSGLDFGSEKIMDPDPVCPERLYPDLEPVNIRPDLQPRK